MNALTKTLLGGVAISALAIVSAAAKNDPGISVSALHAGRVVNKTKVHNHGAMHITYTFSVYSTVAFNDYFKNKKALLGTFYKWNSYSTLCSNPKQKVTFDSKKTQYGKIGPATETYSFGCPSGATVFYGAKYKITDPDAKGHADHFVVHNKGTFNNSRGKYKGTLNLDTTLTIE